MTTTPFNAFRPTRSYDASTGLREIRYVVSYDNGAGRQPCFVTPHKKAAEKAMRALTKSTHWRRLRLHDVAAYRRSAARYGWRLPKRA